MPIVPFDSLPDDARLWVFASDRALTGDAAERLLGETDHFLAEWRAHGQPLSCARDWRDDRFLAVAVDQRDAHASGCSVDGLFRTFQALEPAIGARLVGGGRVFWRDADGAVQAAPRLDFVRRLRAGELPRDVRILDTSVTTLGDWRARFERPAGEVFGEAARR
jgi:hypothetical protein